MGLARRFFVVPHTHWDREWYRPLEHFRLRLGHVVDRVIETLERDPRFRSFTLDGQAIVLEDYLDARPRNEGRLRALLRSGRIEVGPSYVLPDEFLVGAESLVRNLLIGREVCERLGAAPATVAYLPDSFGHPIQLPQILRGFGLESFIFSRGMGDQLDDVGVVFRWVSPDGSEVTAFQQLPHYDNYAQLAGVEDGERRLTGILERFGPALERAGVDAVLLCNGSDHLPIQSELPEICAELEDRVSGSRFTISSYTGYVHAVGDVKVPSWTGELLGSRLQNVLRGVNSARIYIKQANERAERQLLAVETLAALRSLRRGEPFAHADFRLAWRDLLRNHPHDSICGCSCDEVHRDMLVRYESLERTLAPLAQWALEQFGVTGNERRATVANPLPLRRRALVEVDGAEPQIVELNGFEVRTVELAATQRFDAAPGSSIESDLLRLEAAPDGTLTLTDRASGRRYERLHVLEDEPDVGDLYTFCPVEGAAAWRAEQVQTRVLADGPVVWELELAIRAERPAGFDDPATGSMRVATVARLVRGSRRLEFRTTVENHARDHRLRVVFAVGEGHDTARAESAFALVRRALSPPAPKAEWAEPPDVTQHTTGAVALGPIALLTRGLPEYEARRGRRGAELCLTLLRCVGVISKPTGALATRPLGAGPQLPTPEAQCLGRHVLEYALVVDAQALDDLALLRASQDYRSGFLVLPGIAAGFKPPLAVEGDVVFSCLKGAEDGDGLILRCFNPADSPATMRVGAAARLFRTRLDETGEELMPSGTCELAPHQIGTFRLRADAAA